MRLATLQPFEATLVEDLFGGGRTSLAAEAVENELLANDFETRLREDALRRGWLPAGYMTQQDAWRAMGAVLVLAGLPSLFLFLLGFSLGPCLLPLPLLGALALVLDWRLPDITPAGEEVAEVAYTYQRDLRGLVRSRETPGDPATAGVVLPYAAAPQATRPSVDRWPREWPQRVTSLDRWPLSGVGICQQGR